ncbi:uncharacterized protein LOC135221887 [Macrobrachium nipponense]|uniref:uncharacterized protein LOC135221887 n=1 Tax=Macrobrachium nipponense TaxID=159736 RepID=UPI0030C83C56
MQRILAVLLFLSGVGICLSGIMDRRVPGGAPDESAKDNSLEQTPGSNSTENGDENRFYHISEFNSTETGSNRWGGGYFPYNPLMPNSFYPMGSNFPYSAGGCSQYCVNMMGMPECCGHPITQVAPYLPRCPYTRPMCMGLDMSLGGYSMPCQGHMQCMPAQMCCLDTCRRQHVCQPPQMPGNFMFREEFPMLG